MNSRRLIVLCCLAAIASTSPVSADEGMWLLNHLPVKELKAKYGFEPTAAWLEHIQKSCVRIGNGGSGSFVSPDGLVMTNHHVGSDAIADVSDEKHNYIEDGFYAKSHADERKCPDMEITVLMKIEEVTDKINSKITPDMTPAEAFAARKTAMSQIEKEAKEKTGLQPEVVTLYQGARYDLYLYKRYTDVRLVMAPEAQIAFFGGDLDNFEYPRYNLDVCFLRVYENDKPLKTENYLKWSKSGPHEDELIFVAGHPGRTQRLYTMDHLKFLRDVQIAMTLNAYHQREIELIQFMTQGPEQFRRGKEDLMSVQNSRKAFTGIIGGLLNPALMARKQKAEMALRDYVNQDEKRKQELGPAWDNLAKALAETKEFYPDYFMLESRRASLGRLYDLARKLVRAADERKKPDGDRLTEYRDANLPSLEVDLFSTAPFYDDLDRMRLENGLIRMGRMLGGDHPAVIIAFGGKDASSRAAELMAGTKLRDVAFRKKLYEGGTAAIADSDDSMIRFAKEMDSRTRALRKKYEDTFESVEKASYASIAKAGFEMFGEDMYPDATFTLRLAYGSVKGFRDGDKVIPAMTKFEGLYALADKHDNHDPYRLPKRWIDGRSKVDMSAPFNFISTDDIIGGNSGSPMFNKEGEVTGLVFDGNIPGLIWDFQFDMEKGRAVGVHSQAIVESLRKLYGASALADEIIGK
jgi:hypothetical protein